MQKKQKKNACNKKRKHKYLIERKIEKLVEFLFYI